jgi:formate-dependent nitrite reductase membrane component NrfD
VSKHAKRKPFVPKPDPDSYYGRPILKPPAWDWRIPAYLFVGGLSAGSTLLSVGADLSGRPKLCARSRVGALVALVASGYFLISDLGRPERFHHMMRVVKPTSPMSIGTWIITGYGPGIGLAAATELLPARWRGTRLGRAARWLARPAALPSAALAPALASYTAVLLSQTAVPAWNTAHPYLPFIFTGSAAASSGGLGMVVAPVAEAGPARTFAATGAAAELVASRVMESRLGMVGEAYHTGKAHKLRRWSEYLTVGGLVGTLVARRSRTAAVLSGLAFMAGSALQRFGVFEAGVASTQDPRYVVAPQREQLNRTAPGLRRAVAG